MRVLPLAVAAIAASISMAPMAFADDLTLPDRKPGLWELRTQPAGMPQPIVAQMCLDPESDKAMMKIGLSMSECESMTVNHDGDTMLVDATCDVMGAKLKSHTVITGDFQSAYEMKTVSDRISGSTDLPDHSEVTQSAKWVGDCPADMAPGDMMMPGGMKMNILKMLGGG
jgi:hypothetical protein